MALNLNGISNENEFYTHHYLVTILENDLKNLFATWERQEEEQGLKPPHHLLNRLSREYFVIRGQMERAKSAEDVLALQRRFLPELLKALGYTMEPGTRTLDSGSPVPVIGEVLKKSGEPELWILEAVCSSTEATDVLDACLVKAQYSEGDGDKLPLDMNFAEIITKQVFTLPEPPRWVILVGFTSIVLLDRSKWNEKRFLRFDLAEIFGRKELTTFKAMAALLHRNNVCPDDGICLLDSLDENSHKHAFAVSDDLKYSAREAVELIGNEAVYYFREKYKGSVFGERGGDVLSEKQLTEECLRYLYRLLFLFYIEARPELGYAPMRSEEFRTGYSLESLRDLEMIPLTSDESQNGYYINDSLDNLFKLIFDGFNYGEAELALAFDDAPQHHTFRMQPLKCHLFDPARTSLLGKVKFRNSVLQKVIQLLSVSRPGSGRRGRISYAQLGINQLGAVYEGLLSYSGFFAKTDLYEVKKANEQYNEMETAYFISKEELANYENAEKVFNSDGTLKIYPKGAYIYRLAGRNREKSASYYTPEVLTQCLVKYALKELLVEKNADDILQITICEPAMGSGAFLNEGINQLAESYLQKKQKETGQTIGHDVYAQEKQKVKAYLADNNVYGVDLNPTAVELAEVSLWLNSICPGYDGETPTVPWFGNQLIAGNSLIGARRQVFESSFVEESRKGKQTWQDVVPSRVPLGTERPKNSIYHFLLPDAGMADYGDKVVKSMVPDEIAKIKDWRKEITKPFSNSQSATLNRLSDSIDKLWNKHIGDCAKIRLMTRDGYNIFGHDDRNKYTSKLTTQQKDDLFNKVLKSENVRNSSSYRRLKLAMDYWCALWFWPIAEASKLPSRDEWLMELTAILEGGVYDVVPADDSGQIYLINEVAPSQQEINYTADEFGYVNVDELCKGFPRLALVKKLADNFRFHHWELEFADLFAEKGGFDLILGNPPWTRIRLEPQKILSEYNPQIYVRALSASDVNSILPSMLKQNSRLLEDYTVEAASILASRNFIGSRYYDVSGGENSNLYKCFFELSDYCAVKHGIIALLHDAGIYDEPQSAKLRSHLLKNLIYLFHFINQLNHFPEEALGHAGTFAITICKSNKCDYNFDGIFSVFHPKTIDESYSNNIFKPEVPKLKDKNGWILKGHPSRIVTFDIKTLQILNNNQSEAPSNPIPALYATPHLNLQKKRATFASLENIYPDLKGFPIVDETTSQKLGLIKRTTLWPDNPSELILSAPHIYVGTPYFKQPNEGCKSKGDYSSLDLLDIPVDYLPRPVFNLSYPEAYNEIVKSAEVSRSVKYYRLAWRNWVSSSNERTLITTIIPPNVIHINKIMSMAFPNYDDMVYFAGLSFSIIFDYFLRVTNIDNVWNSDILNLPLPSASNTFIKSAIIENALKLTCITRFYEQLWDECSANIPWDRSNMYLTHKSRRDALVRLDVLSSLAIGISLEDLLLIYSTQFPTLVENDSDTYYDSNGRIVFTSNRNYTGIGALRKEWDVYKGMKTGCFSQDIINDTMPDGPVERTITYVAPFYKCDREEDYRTIWAEFERKFAN